MHEFCAGEHGGTHFDAPYHFNKEGWKVPDVPITRLVAKSATIDLRRTETKSLASKHLENWKRQKGVFHTNTFLIIKFGWSKYWNNRNQYIGIDVNGNIDFPGVSTAGRNLDCQFWEHCGSWSGCCQCGS
ncbi:hypothetical protein Zmor_018542 [Zophobas morio]|uniref:Kynurenine formamidase n=1 Tax=Zophobas morio TaxID=2755281 RepID=A0AA38IAD8_9CUCU|nr:hypothetical protein Zmor_018542 [Zophobas morio]